MKINYCLVQQWLIAQNRVDLRQSTIRQIAA
jgi:hypothetical protein